MAIMEVTAMPQDILPAAMMQGRGGEMAPGASEAGGFGRVLQERQSAPDASRDERKLSAQVDAKPGNSSPRQVPGGRQGVRKGTQLSAKRTAKGASEQEDDGAVTEARDGGEARRANSGNAEEASSDEETSRQQDVATIETVQDATETSAATSIAGNGAFSITNETAWKGAATDLLEEAQTNEAAEEIAAEAVSSVGIGSAPDNAAALTETGAGIPLGQPDGAAGMVIATLPGTSPQQKVEGADLATASKATRDAEIGAEKPEQEVPASGGASAGAEGKGAATGSLKTQAANIHVDRTASSQRAGEDEAAARLKAASVVAAAEGQATDAATDEAPQNTAPEGAAGATEKAQQVVDTQSNAGSAAQKGQELAPVTEKNQNGTAAAAESETVVKVDPKEPHTLERGQRRQTAAEEAAEQVTVTSKAPVVERVSGSKAASVADAAQGTLPKGGAGQEGSGGATGKEEQEQTPQGKQGEQILTAALGGVMTPADGGAAESKPTGQRSALHESILSQLKDGVVTHDGKGNGQVSIRLSPQDLGELKIQVRMEDGRVRIEVQADNRMVKDLLMSNLDSLKEALSSKNLTMAGFDVSTGGSSNNSLSEQRGNLQQQPVPRTMRNGYPDADSSGGRVKYLTADVNNLLDVRF